MSGLRVFLITDHRWYREGAFEWGPLARSCFVSTPRW